MNDTKPDTMNVVISDSAVTFTTYFTDQEQIDGKLTVADLTETCCRWPTGNPRDLTTFRYCGEAARRPLLRAPRETRLYAAPAASRLTGRNSLRSSHRAIAR